MVRAARGATRSTEERGGATHTLLTHIEIKCEEALKKTPTAATVHRQEGKFLLVCPAQQPVTSLLVRSAASADP